MTKDKIRETILSIYSGQVKLEDAIELVCEFMIRTKGSVNQQVLQYITNQHDPFAMQMFQHALNTSKVYFEAMDVTITRVFKKDGSFLYAF
jgi:hypothetical protein